MASLQALVDSLRQTWPVRMGSDLVSAAMAPGNALKSTPDNPVTTEQMIKPAADLAGALMMGATAAPPMKDAVGMGIRAYHGSPYDFDRFDLSKIGTGEGAQAYGHGLYFAEAEPVAWSYRFNKAPSYLTNGADSFARQAASMAEDAGLTGNDAKKYALDILHQKAMTLPQSGRQPWFDAMNNYDTLIGSPATPGRMYEVNINAEPQQFLDWDRPLNQNSQSVVNSLVANKWVGPNVSDPTSEFIRGLRPEDQIQLGREGIPGIRYLDQGSRGSGQGTSNYVVFNPDIIDILKKYSLVAGLMGAGAAMPQDQQ